MNCTIDNFSFGILHLEIEFPSGASSLILLHTFVTKEID